MTFLRIDRQVVTIYLVSPVERIWEAAFEVGVLVRYSIQLPWHTKLDIVVFLVVAVHRKTFTILTCSRPIYDRSFASFYINAKRKLYWKSHKVKVTSLTGVKIQLLNSLVLTREPVRLQHFKRDGVSLKQFRFDLHIEVCKVHKFKSQKPRGDPS